MEMTYDGTLVMSSGCALMDEDEAGGIVGKLLDFTMFSVGGAVAEIFDRADGTNDNQIYFSKVSF